MAATTAKLRSLVGDGLYDAVVRIELFTDVYTERGWRVAVTPNEVNYARLQVGCGVRVAPVGKFGVGKTWLLQQLCGGSRGTLRSLPSGANVHTEDFSIKIARPLNDVREVVFLDVAGMDSPVASTTAVARMLDVHSMDNQAALTEMLQEMKRHEAFIRQVAFDFANVFLLVVNQMTQRDQLEFVQLVEVAAARAGGNRKQVIVVHNLKEMTMSDLKHNVDPVTGKSYMENIEEALHMRARRIVVDGDTGGSHHDAVRIDEMWGMFGDTSSNVTVRHLFLTKHGAAGCKNERVLQHIRNVILQRAPTTGNVLRDLASIMTVRARSIARQPTNVEIRFHAEEPTRFIAGISEGKKAALPEPIADPKLNQLRAAADEALEAKRFGEDACHSLAPSVARPTLAEQSKRRDAAQAAEAEYFAYVVEVAARNRVNELDAATLTPIDHPVTAAPVLLVSSRGSSNPDVRYNVARVKAYANGDTAVWLNLVQITLPGLAAGQEEQLKAYIVSKGLTMQQKAADCAETLHIEFTASLVPVPDGQIDLLNAPDAAKRTPLAPVLTVDPNTEPQVVEQGTRPFSTKATATGPAAIGARGAIEVHVQVHTDVALCVFDLPPAVCYRDGMLIVGVASEPSDDDRDMPHLEQWLCGVEPLVPLRPGQ